MLFIVTGGSASGKSDYAEKTAAGLSAGRKGSLIYAATMIRSGDKETEQRIARHRQLRSGKGFCTVECAVNIGSLLSRGSGNTFLIECMSNLLANEMFTDGGAFAKAGPRRYTDIADSCIIAPVCDLSDIGNDVVLVTNEVFSDCGDYTEETLLYIKMLGYINRRLAERADCVTEVVCGIPVNLKGSIKC